MSVAVDAVEKVSEFPDALSPLRERLVTRIALRRLTGTDTTAVLAALGGPDP